MKNKPTVLESPDIVAFLCVKGVIVRPFLRNTDNKVCFEVKEDVTPYIDEFYDNVSVPISDYCKNLKLIRSMIFNLKANKK